MEDWTSLGQHKRYTEFPVVTRESHCNHYGSGLGLGHPLAGQATDIKIRTDNLLRTKGNLNRSLSENTGKPLEEIERDVERDYFMTAQEAMNYGLIDKVVDKR